MIKMSQTERKVKWLTAVILGGFALLCIIPIIAVISISLSDQKNIVAEGYRLIVTKLDFSAYEYIFKAPGQLFNAYKVTTIVTVVGTLFSLTVVSLIAYPLSRSDFKWRKPISFIVFFTLLFNAGMVPLYIVVTKVYHLKDTYFALILPYAANAWHILLLRTFFSKIPFSLIEAAKLDGAGEFQIFFRIILPLSKPAMATIGLFIMLMYWNDWWLSLLFVESQEMVPLQYMMYRIMSEVQYITQQMQSSSVVIDRSSLPTESLRMAMCVFAAGPMLFVFPFFQKYFVKGITVGSVKG